MATVEKVMKLNTAELSLSILKVENYLVKNVTSVADNHNNVSDNLTKEMSDVKLYMNAKFNDV